MGDKLRHDRRGNADDTGDPTETGAHPRQPDAYAGARASTRTISTIEPRRGDPARRVEGSGEQELSARSSRPSIRPSAFGIPRGAPASSTPPTPPRVPDRKRESVPPGVAGRPSTLRSPAEARASVHGPENSGRKRASSGLLPPPIVKTDIEELLPISHGVKSLPRPPRMPGFDPQQLPLASARYFPWASLGVFIAMLVASFAPLSRYRGERRESIAIAAEQHAQRARSDANEPPTSGLSTSAERSSAPLAPAVSAAGQVERALWGAPANVREALLEEGERALHADDAPLAESLFTRALEFDRDVDVDDARAEFGLARVRAAQDDLARAEGWLLRAIQKRPRQIDYRALHAEILERSGRIAEAQMERAAARALAHFSHGTRPR